MKFIEMDKYRDRVENILSQKLLYEESSPFTINEAIRYSFLSGGKRLRPILVLVIADIIADMGSEYVEIQNYAAAVEMIHAYSLIHDDLPAMDDDDLRRGKPSNHKVFGEAMAILAGDALLTKAFELMPVDKTLMTSAPITPNSILLAWKKLAQLAGDSGMIGGQVMDLEAEGTEVDLKYLADLQKLKTGALLRAAITGPAILLNIDEDIINIFDKFAIYLGQAFQVQDDILDVESTENDLGKSIGKDANQGKATYVTMLGVQDAKVKLLELTNLCKNELENIQALGYKVNFLYELVDYLYSRKS